MALEVCSPQDLLQVGAVYQAIGTFSAGLVSAAVALITTNRILTKTAQREQQKLHSEALEKKISLRREKLEKLVELCCEQCNAETLQMKDFIGACISWSHKATSVVASNVNINYIDEAEAIQVMYFPELESQVKKIRKVGYQLNEFKLIEINAVTQNREAWLATQKPTLGNRAGTALQSLVEARLDLIKVAKSILERLDIFDK